MKTEQKIQQEIFQWFTNTYCLKHHSPRSLILSIPNEGKPSLVMTGLYPGASDLLVVHLGVVYFIEVKTETGKQSDNQKKFEQHIHQMEMNYYLVRSLEDFQNLFNTINNE
jgi:hypothetical protein